MASKKYLKVLPKLCKSSAFFLICVSKDNICYYLNLAMLRDWAINFCNLCSENGQSKIHPFKAGADEAQLMKLQLNSCILLGKVFSTRIWKSSSLPPSWLAPINEASANYASWILLNTPWPCFTSTSIICFLVKRSTTF